jgi:glycosyltransferase involved in cell wall biosynthesis
VRDEERTLAACLESARDLVDEICIVDTGSTDRTQEIARSFGAKLRTVPWKDSFAEARNASLEMASGDWILVLDADETIRPEAGPELRKLAAQTAVLGAFARLIDHACSEASEDWVMRFFKNDPEHRFVGAIHNQLCPAFQLEAEQEDRQLELASDFVIDHHGHGDTERLERKRERSLRLYARALREEPDNLYVRYKYADFLLGEAPELALQALDTVCERIGAQDEDWRASYTWCTEAYALHALELMNRGQLERAAERLEQATYCPATANLCFVYALWCLRTEQWAEALQAFQDCRGITGPERMQAPAPGVLTWKSGIGMGEALIGLGLKQEALELVRREAAENPHCAELRTRSLQLDAEVHGTAECSKA